MGFRQKKRQQQPTLYMGGFSLLLLHLGSLVWEPKRDALLAAAVLIMSCHRSSSSSSLWNWNIDYAELWSYLVVWERWLRGENVPLLSLSSNRSKLSQRGGGGERYQRARDTHTNRGHGHEIRHLQCLASLWLASLTVETEKGTLVQEKPRGFQMLQNQGSKRLH